MVCTVPDSGKQVEECQIFHKRSTTQECLIPGKRAREAKHPPLLGGGSNLRPCELAAAGAHTGASWCIVCLGQACKAGGWLGGSRPKRRLSRSKHSGRQQQCKWQQEVHEAAAVGRQAEP